MPVRLKWSLYLTPCPNLSKPIVHILIKGNLNRRLCWWFHPPWPPKAFRLPPTSAPVEGWAYEGLYMIQLRKMVSVEGLLEGRGWWRQFYSPHWTCTCPLIEFAADQLTSWPSYGVKTTAPQIGAAQLQLAGKIFVNILSDTDIAGSQITNNC